MRGKAEVIIKAASEVFLSRGFAGASVDDIAAHAGVSKRTIYKHFESKERLFANIIIHTSKKLVLTLNTSLSKSRDPRETLTELARDYLDLILSREALEIYRLVIAESTRFPELTSAFHQSGAARVSEALASYFNEWQKSGAIQVADPQIAAEQFMGSCVGTLRLRALFDPVAAPDPAWLDNWVAQAVDRFLQGVTPRS